MRRIATHRCDYRAGPWHAWTKKRAYHLLKLFKACRALGALLADLQPVGPGLYRSSRAAAVFPAAREAYADALPYLEDETGEVWS